MVNSELHPIALQTCDTLNERQKAQAVAVIEALKAAGIAAFGYTARNYFLRGV